MRSLLRASARVLAVVAMFAAAAPGAAAQEIVIPPLPPAADGSAPGERTLLKDGTLYSRLLDVPPFTVGDVASSRPAALPSLYVSFVALEMADGYSTSRGLRSGASEANPLFRWATEHSASLWAVKGAAAAGTIAASEVLWRRGRRRQAITVMLVSNAIMGIVAAKNVSVISASR